MGETPIELAATGEVIWVNPPGNKGRIHRDDDGDMGNYEYNVAAGDTDAGWAPSLGDRVTFTEGPGNTASDVMLSGVVITPGTDAVLTFDGEPDFSLFIFADSTSFPDGETTGQLTVESLEIIPLPAPTGVEPAIKMALLPAGVHFDPPAKITIPNSFGSPPSSSVNMHSFDHDTGVFEPIGTGTVSDDGTLITSDPGFGIVKGG